MVEYQERMPHGVLGNIQLGYQVELEIRARIVARACAMSPGTISTAPVA